MIRYVAVIDLGKTNSKVALVDTQNGEETEVIKQPTTARFDLYPCLDHEGIESFVVGALRTLGESDNIDAITVTTHGATAALLDKSGNLALPVIDYEFSGIDDLRGDYEKLRPPFADSGSPALPGGLNIGAQLHWQQVNFPEEFANASTLLTWPQYWVYRLTGERHNDLSSLGCHTDLYEPISKRYSSLVKKLGWNSLMPPTQHSGALCGNLTRAMADRTSLPEATPVYTGIHDSNASLVPHLIAQTTPFSVVSTGTWFITMAMGGSDIQLDETRDTLINVNARGEPVPSSRFMGGREKELLELTNAVTEQSMNRFLNNKLSATTMLMPSVVTGTGPYPKAQTLWLEPGTAISDLDRTSEQTSESAIERVNAQNDDQANDRACAAVLYLALMTQECLMQVGADGPTFIEGPLAYDQQFTQMVAAVTDREVLVGASSTGTSVGAAMLINSPKKDIEYATVKLHDTKRAQLISYANAWQNRLLIHSK